MTHEDFLIAELDRLLAPHVLDGTEGAGLLEELAATVRNADGDLVRIRSAVHDTKLRLHTLIADTVPRDAVNNVICRIVTLAKSTNP